MSWEERMPNAPRGQGPSKEGTVGGECMSCCVAIAIAHRRRSRSSVHGVITIRIDVRRRTMLILMLLMLLLLMSGGIELDAWRSGVGERCRRYSRYAGCALSNRRKRVHGVSRGGGCVRRDGRMRRRVGRRRDHRSRSSRGRSRCRCRSMSMSASGRDQLARPDRVVGLRQRRMGNGHMNLVGTRARGLDVQRHVRWRRRVVGRRRRRLETPQLGFPAAPLLFQFALDGRAGKRVIIQMLTKACVRIVNGG